MRLSQATRHFSSHQSLEFAVLAPVYAVYIESEEPIMASPVLSFRVEEAQVEQLDQLSQATDRDRQYHLKRALARLIEKFSACQSFSVSHF